MEGFGRLRGGGHFVVEEGRVERRFRQGKGTGTSRPRQYQHLGMLIKLVIMSNI